MKFEFYAGKASLNGVHCAVYTVSDDSGYYYLKAEKNGKKIAGTRIARMSVEDYENLPYSENNLIRLQAALAKCGFFFKKDE